MAAFKFGAVFLDEFLKFLNVVAVFFGLSEFLDKLVEFFLTFQGF